MRGDETWKTWGNTALQALSEKTYLRMKFNKPEISQNLKLRIGGVIGNGLLVSIKYILR